MEVIIGEEDGGGIKIRFNGEFIQVEVMDSGWLSPNEARMAADAMKLMADYLERSINDGN